MTHRLRSLLKHELLWIIVIKMIVLYALWAAFIKPNKVHVTPDNVANTMLSSTNTNTTTGDNDAR